MSLITPIAAANPAKQDGGRGGIRTHGGFPHARFRVECLKPDSATLPQWQEKTSNAQRRTSNLECNSVRHWAFGVGRFICQAKYYLCFQYNDGGCVGRHALCASLAKNVTIFNLPCPWPGLHIVCPTGQPRYYLLFVVDWYSQVVGAAVHQYSHLIRNFNPSSPP